jgi:hypothetical protein
MGSLLHSAGSWQRPRIRAAVGRGGPARSGRPPESGNVDGKLERSRLTERARFAENVDIALRVACRSEAASRHELGIVARELLRGRGYRRLGFVRLSDYAAISWVCALTLLPVVDRANAAAWIARADTVTVRRLADEVS